MIIQLAFVTSVKVFIFTGLIVTIVNHIQDRDSFLLRAAAGKKSSKASSKTTVIAIDGGGGGGKAHPMPVPWPVVHCHHHHHHLKYVPKPVLVHHWVKKYKPYDFAATEQQIIMPMMKQPLEHSDQHHSDSQYVEHGGYQPTILNPSKKLPTELMSMQTSSQLMSNLNSLPDGIPAAWHNQQRLQPSSSQTVSLPPVLVDGHKQKVAKEVIEKEIRKLQMNQAAANFNKILQSKQLNQLAKSLLSNTTNTPKNSKYSLDEDSEDSLKSVSLANKTLSFSHSSEQKFNNLDKDSETFAEPRDNSTQQTIGKSSSNNQGFFVSDFEPRKPSHPFNEYHDQIIDESKPNFVSSPGDTKDEMSFVNSLEQANLRERSEAELLFEKYTSENAGRLQALRNFQLMNPQNLMHIPTLNQQAGSQLRQQQHQNTQQGNTLLQPHINARMANTLSESNTIEVMTKIAAQMAQNEAKKVMLRQNQSQRKRPSSSRTNFTSHGSQGASSKTRNSSFLKNLNLLSLFETPSLRSHRDRRRVSSPSALAYQIHWPQNIALTPTAFATNFDGSIKTLQIPPRKQPEFVDSYQIAHFLPNQRTASPDLATLRDHQTATSFFQSAASDLLTAQSSNAINRVVDPSAPSKKTNSFDISRNSASASNMHQGDYSSSRMNRVKTIDQQNSRGSSTANEADSRQVMLPAATIKAIGESNNVATTMSPEQESRFYSGQREHLSRIQRQKQNQASQPAQTSPNQVAINEATTSSGSTNSTKVYNSSPSNIYDSVAHPSQPLSSTGNSQQSMGDVDQNEKGQFVNLPSWEHQQQEQHQHSLLQPPNQLFSIHQQASSGPLTVQEQLGQGSQQLYQQQLFPANSDLLTPMSSYLEFPLSPQQWSSEAIKSINSVSDSGEAGVNLEQNMDQEKGLKEYEAIDSQKTHAASSMESASSQQDLEAPMEYFSSNSQLPLQSQNKIILEQLGSNQHASMPVVNNKLYPQALFATQNLDLQKLHSRIPQQMALSPYSYFPQMSADLGLRYLQAASNSKPAYSSFIQHQQQHPTMDFSTPSLVSTGGPIKAAPSIDSIQSVIAFGDNSPITDTSPAYDIGGLNTESLGIGPGYPIPKTSSKNGKKSATSTTLGVASSGTQPNYYSDSDLKGISNTNQPDTMLTATNEMNQLRQFQNSLSQNVNHADNVTAMARLSAQLRDQMRTLQQRLPSMPNIPNVPQPPQIPNIPMPPPGMMQMAGLALPFAMARARENRIRNQQINAAANGGGGGSSGPGSSPGQRLLNSASSFTNRLIRSRRRPNSPPTTSNKGFSSSSGSNKNPTRTRRGFSNLVQLYVDMRKKPSSSSKPPSRLTSLATSAALSAGPKMKPKVDKVRENKSKRLGRSVDYISASRRPVASSFSGKYNTYFGNSSSNTGIAPGSLYAAMNDGSLTRFHSMTSPVDTYAHQLTQQATQPQGSSQYKPDPDLEYSGQDVDEQQQRFRLSAGTQYNPSFKNHKVAIGHFERVETGKPLKDSINNGRQLFPIPLVANHINLLLFTAQNVTGSLIKPHTEREKDQQQQQQQTYDLNQITPENDMQRQQQHSVPPQTSGEVSEQIVGQEQVQEDVANQQQNINQLVLENSGDAQLSRLNSQSNESQDNKREVASENKQQEATQAVLEENQKKISSQQHQSDHQQQAVSKEQVDYHRPDSTSYAPSIVRITEQNSPFKPTGSAIEKNRDVPIVRTTRSPLVSTRSIFGSASSTTTKPTSTSTFTSSTTALPVVEKPNQGNVKTAWKNSKSFKWENSGKMGKFKRSTKRPENESSNMQKTELSLLDDTSEATNWSAQGAGVLPQISAATAHTTPMSKATQSTSVSAEERKGEKVGEGEVLVTLAPIDATDYVRAIKLVRGVAYPWPPPTKSSKLFESQDTITSIAADGA